MEKVSLEQFIAEIETTFSNYSDTNDLDKQSIKTWTIQALRKFGKNICDTHETLVEVKNGRALLPETFKSLIFAVKVDLGEEQEKKERGQLINEKRYIENPAVWDSYAQQYIVNFCETKITTEKTFAKKVSGNSVCGMQVLELEDYISKDVLDVDCLNLHPSVRNKNNNRISIVNRTLNSNFKDGFVYLKYNSLPQIDDEVAIPVITSGDILNFLENEIKWKIAESLIANNRNSQGLSQLYSQWKSDSQRLLVFARSEANWKGLGKSWDRKIARQNQINRLRWNL